MLLMLWRLKYPRTGSSQLRHNDPDVAWGSWTGRKGGSGWKTVTLFFLVSFSCSRISAPELCTKTTRKQIAG